MHYGKHCERCLLRRLHNTDVSPAGLQSGHDDATRDGAAGRPAGEQEVDGQDGEQGRVAELVVGAAWEQQAQAPLAVHVQQAGGWKGGVTTSHEEYSYRQDSADSDLGNEEHVDHGAEKRCQWR